VFDSSGNLVGPNANIADFNKVDNSNDSLAVIRAKQAAQLKTQYKNSTGINKIDNSNDSLAVIKAKQAAQLKSQYNTGGSSTPPTSTPPVSKPAPPPAPPSKPNVVATPAPAAPKPASTSFSGGSTLQSLMNARANKVAGYRSQAASQVGSNNFSGVHVGGLGGFGKGKK
jgi:hypothetical protein